MGSLANCELVCDSGTGALRFRGAYRLTERQRLAAQLHLNLEQWVASGAGPQRGLAEGAHRCWAGPRWPLSSVASQQLHSGLARVVADLAPQLRCAEPWLQLPSAPGAPRCCCYPSPLAHTVPHHSSSTQTWPEPCAHRAMDMGLDELRGLAFAAEALRPGSAQQSHRALQVQYTFALGGRRPPSACPPRRQQQSLVSRHCRCCAALQRKALAPATAAMTQQHSC